MKPYTTRHVAWIRLCYLTPLLCCLVLLAIAGIPHLFYTFDGEALDTMSLFRLLSNTYQTCIGFIKGTAAGSVGALYFSYIMMAFFALSLLCMILYAIFALYTAIMSMTVWQPLHPGTQAVNTAKRYYRLFVPNRGFYIFFNLLPLLPFCFPYILQGFYRSVLGQSTTVHYFGLPDVVYVLLLSAAAIVSFVLTRSAQKELKMDLFRLYKQ